MRERKWDRERERETYGKAELRIKPNTNIEPDRQTNRLTDRQ